MIGICGGGVGGLATAVALSRRGKEVVVFEQAGRFGRVGADVNLTPNAVVVLDGLAPGIGEAIRRDAARPVSRISRTWDTGEVTSRLVMGDEAEQKYGSPQLTLHRADLLDALQQALPEGIVTFDSKAVAIVGEGDGDTVTVELANGERVTVDLLIGADGVHSMVRGHLHGSQPPTKTGMVAYRAVVPRERLAGVPDLDSFTKWWGPDAQTQIVTFPLTRGEETFVFATVAEDWSHESWTTPGRAAELQGAFDGFHADARALLAACDEVTKSALVVRDPLPFWSRGRITILGDAAHPMTPFMAQGACMALEDAAVLARCIDEVDDPVVALQAFEQARLPRTSRVQLGSRANNWLRDSTDADWLYGYDAWHEPLPLVPA